MISCDTNIFVYYFDQECPEHDKAYSFFEKVKKNKDFIISEQVLTELFAVLQNPKGFKRILKQKDAYDICTSLRSNPNWQILESFDGVMSEVWSLIKINKIRPHQIYDLRLALTLKMAGVKTFYTRNTKDFKLIGFEKVIDPIE